MTSHGIATNGGYVITAGETHAVVLGGLHKLHLQDLNSGIIKVV